MQVKTANPGVVAVLAYEGLSMFEFAAALRVFGPTEAADLGIPWYELIVCGEQPFARTDDGLRVEVPRRLRSLSRAHTVVVPPCADPSTVPDTVLAALRRAHARGARLVSLCTGAFVLARAGLLDGRTAVTHWAECARLAASYPAVTVDAAQLYVDDGDVLTAAGSAASLDLCLHVVRTDFGAEIANRLARLLVLAPHRDGGQAQFIETPMPTHDAADLFAATTQWMRAHLDQPLHVAELAHRSAMSPRSFARHFTATTGATPYQWLLRERTALAQRLLETTDLPLAAVAGRAGLGDATNLRTQLRRRAGMSPGAYRQRFGHPSAAGGQLGQRANSALVGKSVGSE